MVTNFKKKWAPSVGYVREPMKVSSIEAAILTTLTLVTCFLVTSSKEAYQSGILINILFYTIRNRP